MSGILSVDGTGDSRTLNNKISVDEGMVGWEKLVCDGVVNSTVLFLGHE